MNNRSHALLLVVFALVAVGIFLLTSDTATAPTEPIHTPPNGELVSTATYRCDDNKSIAAEYYDHEVEQPTEPGMPPIPGGTVILRLSDERTLTLPQTISGSGVRYANASESIVFFNKGNTAILMEGGVENFTHCKE